MNLDKLTPAPWELDIQSCGVYICHPDGRAMLMAENDDDPTDLAALEFAALARNAFDVMMRRGWWAEPGHTDTAGEGYWFAMMRVKDRNYDAAVYNPPLPWPKNPFTALVEADKWYKENVEAKEAANG